MFHPCRQNSRPFFHSLAWFSVFGLCCKALLLTSPLLAKGISSATTDQITQMIASNDGAQQKNAVDRINDAVFENSYDAARVLRKNWMPALFDAKLYADIEDISFRMVLARSTSITDVEYFMEKRIRAFLKLGKAKEALSCAKSYFNVVTMKNTSNAMTLVAECLNAAYPDKPELAEQFRNEQIAGATTETPAGSKVLTNITVDPKPYDEAIANLSADEDRYGVGKGNLLLLGNRTHEAREHFEKLLEALTSQKSRFYTINDVARAIKAEDGTIGRANAWLKKQNESRQAKSNDGGR